MKLSQEKICQLITLISSTAEQEIDCNYCAKVIAEFAEHSLRGKTLVEGQAAIEQHLSVCNECSEEFEALKIALSIESG